MRYSETTCSDSDAMGVLLDRVAAVLLREHLMLVTVESCTGGGVAHAATAVPGSSAWFDRGWVTYGNSAKSDMVGVDPVLIHSHGAVSEPVVRAMLRGALARCGSGRVGVALTGVAGPDGGTPEKPVGTVYIAWGVARMERVEARLFAGNRAQVREQSVRRALEGVIELLESPD